MAVVSVLLGLILAVGAPPARGAATTFTTTGVTHTWTVPTGVEVAQFVLNGGSGSAGGSAGAGSGGSGGSGAAFASSLSVTAGETLSVGIGENASGATGGASGLSAGVGGAGGDALGVVPLGGAGGGATIVKQGSAVLLVAGGGGGGGAAAAASGSASGSATGGAGGGGGVNGIDSAPVPSDGERGDASGGSTFGGNGGTGGSQSSGDGQNGEANISTCGSGGGGAGGSGGGRGIAVQAYDPIYEAYGCGGGGGGSSFSDSTRDAGMSVFSDSSMLSGSGRVIINTIEVSTASLPTGTPGSTYSATLQSSGSVITYGGTTTSTATWSVTPALPSGLSLSSGGVISGTPATASSGTYTVTATISDVLGVVARSSKSLTLTIAGTPTISTVAPGTGPVVGGMSVQIDGTNLTGATSVTFGSASAAIVSNTDTRVTATVPAGNGTVDVSVTTAGGTATKSAAFTYASPTISGVSPSSGSALGGMSVYVDGTNLTYATSVTFGGVAGTITNVTDTRVTVTTPSRSTTGAVDVIATASGGTSATSPSAYTFTASAPQSPTAVSAVGGVERATVSWTAGLNGGQPVTFVATSTPGGLTCTTTASSCTVGDLNGGTAYTFRVVATNATGSSTASSPSSAVTPSSATVPQAPTAVTASATSGQAQVSWSTGGDGGRPVLDYTVTSTPGSFTCTIAVTTCTVTGLTDGTSYTFVVTARNSIGSSSASTPSNAVTPSAGGSGGSSGPAPDPAMQAPVPAATSGASSPEPPAPESTASTQHGLPPATIPGLLLPTRIKAPGTTVLVRSTLRTADGIRVRARATVRPLAARNADPDASVTRPPARIIYGPKGRVSVVNSGRATITVTLRLTARATTTSRPLDQVHRWSVLRAAR